MPLVAPVGRGAMARAAGWAATARRPCRRRRKPDGIAGTPAPQAALEIG